VNTPVSNQNVINKRITDISSSSESSFENWEHSDYEFVDSTPDNPYGIPKHRRELIHASLNPVAVSLLKIDESDLTDFEIEYRNDVIKALQGDDSSKMFVPTEKSSTIKELSAVNQKIGLMAGLVNHYGKGIDFTLSWGIDDSPWLNAKNQQLGSYSGSGQKPVKFTVNADGTFSKPKLNQNVFNNVDWLLDSKNYSLSSMGSWSFMNGASENMKGLSFHISGQQVLKNVHLDAVGNAAGIAGVGLSIYNAMDANSKSNKGIDDYATIGKAGTDTLMLGVGYAFPVAGLVYSVADFGVGFVPDTTFAGQKVTGWTAAAVHFYDSNIYQTHVDTLEQIHKIDPTFQPYRMKGGMK
jgi:hypothetical protein